MGTVFDPLRRKEVKLTPEEAVRQWFITILHSKAYVPMHMMMSEVAFTFSSKNYRADIVVYDRSASALAVVECKRPEVVIGPEVIEQALRYNIVLGVSWLFITNGDTTLAFKNENGVFKPYSSLPDYDSMICNR